MAWMNVVLLASPGALAMSLKVPTPLAQVIESEPELPAAPAAAVLPMPLTVLRELESALHVLSADTVAPASAVHCEKSLAVVNNTVVCAWALSNANDTIPTDNNTSFF